MSPMIEKISVDEIEHSLCQINDVKAVRIVVGDGQSIEEIHVLANPSKGPKQLARDIESMLMARYGIPVNHRKISIAQIASQDNKVNRARPKLHSVSHEVYGRRAKVYVTLEFGGEKYEGVEEGAASRVGRLRLVAGATIRAIEKMVPDTYSFALEDITVTNLARDVAVIVSIAILSLSGDETIAGCVLVRGDEREAVVRAVLDAVNRRLSFLITA